MGGHPSHASHHRPPHHQPSLGMAGGMQQRPNSAAGALGGPASVGMNGQLSLGPGVPLGPHNPYSDPSGRVMMGSVLGNLCTICF